MIDKKKKYTLVQKSNINRYYNGINWGYRAEEQISNLSNSLYYCVDDKKIEMQLFSFSSRINVLRFGYIFMSNLTSDFIRNLFGEKNGQEKIYIIQQ